MKQWLWPDIDDLQSAKNVCHNAAGGAFFVAVATAVIVTLQITGKLELVKGIGAEAYIDAGAFLLIGVFLLFKSRIAAIVGLLLYVAEQAFMIQMTGFRFNLMAIFMVLLFMAGVRGTFAFHRFRKEERESGGQGQGAAYASPYGIARPAPATAPAVDFRTGDPGPAAVSPEPVSAETQPAKKKNFVLVFACLAILVAGGAATFILAGPAIFSKQKGGAGPSFNLPPALENLKLPEVKLPAISLPGSDSGASSAEKKSKASVASRDDSSSRTFRLKTGEVVKGKVVYEDDVYYTVETGPGSQQILIKEDLSS